MNTPLRSVLVAGDIHLPTLLEKILAVWEPEATARRIELALEPGEPPAIKADRDKLRRVLDHLVKNALEAINEAPGTVRCTIVILTPEKITPVVEGSEPGIPNDLEAYRPFETTMPDGTGLGLPIVRQIIAEYGGGIDFATLQAHGTAFRIESPCHGPSVLRFVDSARGG